MKVHGHETGRSGGRGSCDTAEGGVADSCAWPDPAPAPVVVSECRTSSDTRLVPVAWYQVTNTIVLHTQSGKRKGKLEIKQKTNELITIHQYSNSVNLYNFFHSSKFLEISFDSATAIEDY